MYKDNKKEVVLFLVILLLILVIGGCSFTGFSTKGELEEEQSSTPGGTEYNPTTFSSEAETTGITYESKETETGAIETYEIGELESPILFEEISETANIKTPCGEWSGISFEDAIFGTDGCLEQADKIYSSNGGELYFKFKDTDFKLDLVPNGKARIISYNEDWGLNNNVYVKMTKEDLLAHNYPPEIEEMDYSFLALSDNAVYEYYEDGSIKFEDGKLCKKILSLFYVCN